jgi:hypothetical protein
VVKVAAVPVILPENPKDVTIPVVLVLPEISNFDEGVVLPIPMRLLPSMVSVLDPIIPAVSLALVILIE